MKIYLLSILCFLLSFFTFSQKKVVASGGNATGNGSVSYSIGQLFVSTNTGSNASISEGIQQSIELFTLSNPEITTLDLKAITYPNPTKDKIILSLTDTLLKELTFSMYDINGRLVNKGEVIEENTTIPMKNFASDIYLLKVHQNNKQLKVFKIIKN